MKSILADSVPTAAAHDAVAAFRPKIDRIVSIHWAHCAELRAAVVALHASAFGYGFTDDDIEAEFRKLVPA